MLQSFADHFSFQDMMAIRAASAARRAVQQESPEEDVALKNFIDTVKDTMPRALLSYIKEKHKLGLLAPCSNGRGYDCRFTKAWDAIAGNTERYQENPGRQWESIEQYFGKMSFNLARAVAPYTDVEAWPVERLYQHLVETVDSGNIEWFQTDINDRCSNTDKRLVLQFNNWVPELWYFNVEQNEHFKAELLEERPPIQHTSVTFPSGKLLISDWFRIPEFTAMTEDNTRPSLNSALGIETQVRDYASKLNFISVYVGNSSPHIFERNGDLVFARDDNDSNSAVEVLGRVCTDLWWTTIIDKETLVGHLTPSLGEAAEQVVDDYIEENDVTMVEVRPGTYNLYFATDSHTFAKEFVCEELDITNFEHPFFLLTPNALTLKHPIENASEVGLTR